MTRELRSALDEQAGVLDELADELPALRVKLRRDRA